MSGGRLSGAEEFETERLVVRLVRPDDLDALLDVYLSNSDYLAFTEGSDDEPGRYDRGMLERDVVVAGMESARRTACIFRSSDDALVGVVDWREDADDGEPWIGLLMIRADHQRQGLASEVFAGLAGQFRAAGKRVVRMGVIRRNTAGRALVERLGFEEVARRVVRMASEEEVIVFERLL